MRASVLILRGAPQSLAKPARRACRSRGFAGALAAWLLAGVCLAGAPAIAQQQAPSHPPQSVACAGDENVRLLGDAQGLPGAAEFAEAPALRIYAVNAPPLSKQKSDGSDYTGIGPDIFCFIAKKTGLNFEYIQAADNPDVADKIARVQSAAAEVFMPLSYTAARAARGIFTQPFYANHYVAIALKARRLAVSSTQDLANYRVGLVHGVAMEAILREIVPPAQLFFYDQLLNDGVFQALRDGDIDIAVFSKGFFAEQRYNLELFDMDEIYTLHEYPREYGFYFSNTPENKKIVAAFDAYLGRIDFSASYDIHESGERDLIERYVNQKSQRNILIVASAVALLLALAAFIWLRVYRNLLRQIKFSNERILMQQQELQSVNRDLHELSRTDPLCNLPNRRSFDEALARALRRKNELDLDLSLLMIDIDHFKAVNDHYGHAVGDKYLRVVADVLRAALSENSAWLAARYGGEEFTVLLPDAALPQATALAEKIRLQVAAKGLLNSGAADGVLTISLGVVHLPPGVIKTALEVLDQADMQLYRAKQAGRNQVRAQRLS